MKWWRMLEVESESSLSVMETPTILQGLKSLPIRRVFLRIQAQGLSFSGSSFMFLSYAITEGVLRSVEASKLERSKYGATKGRALEE